MGEAVKKRMVPVLCAVCLAEVARQGLANSGAAQRPEDHRLRVAPRRDHPDAGYPGVEPRPQEH
jgi:hypothetical protein